MDKVLECVLNMLEQAGEFMLIPMYACHLTAEGQGRWYRKIMQSIFDSEAPDLHLWFLVSAFEGFVVLIVVLRRPDTGWNSGRDCRWRGFKDQTIKTTSR